MPPNDMTPRHLVASDDKTGSMLLAGLHAHLPLTTQDGLGQQYGLLCDWHTGRLTVSVRVTPVSALLSTQDNSERWIGSYAARHVARGFEPTIEWSAIVVEYVPSAGTDIADRAVDPVNPLAAHTAHELVTAAPDFPRRSRADLSVRVNITFQPERAWPTAESEAERIAEVSRAVAGLEADLSLFGLASLGRAAAAQWTQWLHSTYDRGTRGDRARLPEAAHLLAWADAGTADNGALVDQHWHDSGYSVSWMMPELPHESMTSNVLAPLFAGGRYRRRVCIAYTPYSASRAGDTITWDASGSTPHRHVRRHRGTDHTVWDGKDGARAIHASGPETGTWVLYVTATVEDPRRLHDAVADVEMRARHAQLRLRRCSGWQRLGFAASLGAGIYPLPESTTPDQSI